MVKKLIFITLIFIAAVQAATITTEKEIFKTNEPVIAGFVEMTGLNDDWIAVYPAGTNNDWDNVVEWKWTNDIAAGNVNFGTLPVGNYEIRAFYNNSYNVEASHAFSVEAGNGGNQAILTTTKEIFKTTDDVRINFENINGSTRDWLAIYPAGSSNAWANVIQWKWNSGGVQEGQANFGKLPIGDYEARVFYNNTFNLEASKNFQVRDGVVEEINVQTDKETYTPAEPIVATYTNLAAANNNWMGIYAKDSANTWGNMIQWTWVKTANGNHNFNALPAGEYQVRIYYNNSFNVETSFDFTVEAEVDDGVVLTSQKEFFAPQELLLVDFDNMRGTGSDWIGLFEIGADNAKDSSIQWKYAQSSVSGTVSFDGLTPGTYEVRAFFATSYRKTIEVTVQDTASVSTLYEDAEDGFDQEWISTNVPVTIINVGAAGSSHSIRAQRGSGSYFSFSNPEKKMRFLELDTRIGTASHVGNFGVLISTKNGNRRLLFSSYMNHSNGHGGNDMSGNAIPLPPFTQDGYIHMHPGPTDYYLETRNGSFVHYKINIEEKLRILEPDNELLSIKLFTSAGGDFDNISLVSH